MEITPEIEAFQENSMEYARKYDRRVVGMIDHARDREPLLERRAAELGLFHALVHGVAVTLGHVMLVPPETDEAQDKLLVDLEDNILLGIKEYIKSLPTEQRTGKFLEE